MSPRTAALTALDAAGISATLPEGPLSAGLRAGAVRWTALGGPLAARREQALAELDACIRVVGSGDAILNEGGVYDGAWLESTVTINAEVLDRFTPEVTEATHRRLAAGARTDGLLPYKVTPQGYAYSQIQTVTPLARCVWLHAQRMADPGDYLRTMYAAMTANDAWLARHRNTRGTGAVEAFCTFDTGHDLSPRFWFAPDRAFGGDAAQVDPSSPTLPYLAPDLTANVVCQRRYLALIAEAIGEDGVHWEVAAEASEAALWRHCFDEADGIFYDRDRTGAQVRVQSDVLLRVLACEVGDADFVTAALERYLMHTGKFLAHYGLTSLAMDDPRFDHDFRRNSWGGPVNFLTMLRAPAAFERHGHVAELGLITMQVLSALARADRFPQCLDPWSGDAGYTEVYSPSILWFLDALERYCGVLEQADGSVWLSGLTPTRLDHGTAAQAVASGRRVADTDYALVADDALVDVYRNGELWLSFPRGVRVELSPDGAIAAAVGLAAAPVAGSLFRHGAAVDTVELELAPNERIAFVDGQPQSRSNPGFVAPRW